MKVKNKVTKKKLSEKEIDEIVVSQADDDSAWEEPIKIHKAAKPSSLSIPAEIALRAAFLAKLHREKNIEKWLTRIIRERIELEEVAFREVKREMSNLSNCSI